MQAPAAACAVVGTMLDHRIDLVTHYAAVVLVPGLGTASLAHSRRSLRSVASGLEHVREVFSGRCSRSTSSISSSRLCRCNYPPPC